MDRYARVPKLKNMFGLKAIAGILCVLIVNVQSSSDCAPKACEVRARTDAGWVCGRLRIAENLTEYASFRGVPYGKPPVGERRFKELEPVDPWEGDWDATEDSPACPQKEIIYGALTLQPKGMSEDSIYLNIHVPSKHLPQENTPDTVRPGLPILVMIHGGAFNTGSGLTDLHGAEYLITKDVIVVTFNYRINIIGFMSLHSAEIPGNQGLRDQVTLLRWVQRNAKAFGGDPDNVTLMGQSAGASCAHLLTLSKATEGLFKRVILMSGTSISNFYTASPKFATDIANSFLSYLNINSTDPSEIHRQLVQLPLIDIMYANTLVQNEFGLTSFVPTVEENEYPNVTRILDGTPLELMAQRRGKEYPILMGFTDKEAESFKWFSMVINMLGRVEENPSLILGPRLLYNLPADELNSLAQKVNDKVFNGTKTLEKLLNYLTHSYFTYPAMKIAEWSSDYAPVYLYKYSYKSQRSLIKEALWSMYDGAGHIEDLTFVFRVNSMMKDYVSFPPKTDDDKMKDWMTTMVTNFMRCSNPTCEQEETNWPRFTTDKAQYQSIAEPYVYSMSELNAVELDMMNFIDSFDVEIRDFKN